MPDTIKDNFKLLKNSGIIDEALTHKMESMVGFRNVAIHDYQTINRDILKSILSNNLRDLEDFYTAVLLHFKIAARQG